MGLGRSEWTLTLRETYLHLVKWVVVQGGHLTWLAAQIFYCSGFRTLYFINHSILGIVVITEGEVR